MKKKYVVFLLVVTLLLISGCQEKMAENRLKESDGITPEIAKGIGQGEITFLEKMQNVKQEGDVTILPLYDSYPNNFGFSIGHKGMLQSTFTYVYLDGEQVFKGMLYDENSFQAYLDIPPTTDPDIIHHLEVVQRDENEKIVFYQYKKIKYELTKSGIK